MIIIALAMHALFIPHVLVFAFCHRIPLFQHSQKTDGELKHDSNFLSSRDPQLPDGSCRKEQDDHIRDNVEQAREENAGVIVETSSVLYERIPNGFTWRTSEDGDESADGVVYPSDHNYDPRAVPHEGVYGFGGSKQTNVLQQ
jgi:hypothetical protein